MLTQPRSPIPFQVPRVLRKSGPAVLPTVGLLADWYAGDGSEVPTWMLLDTVNDDRVEEWDGTDGTSVNLISTSFSAQPFFEQTVPSLGNRGGVRFDGGQYIYADTTALLASLSVSSFYGVFSTTSTTWSTLGKVSSLYSEGRTTTLTPFYSAKVNDEIDGQAGFDMRSDGSVSISMLGGNQGLNDGNPHLLTIRRVASNDWRMRVDGVEVDTGSNAPGTTTINKITLGCLWRTSRDHFMNGYIGRIRLYNVDNYADVEPVLADFYGI